MVQQFYAVRLFIRQYEVIKKMRIEKGIGSLEWIIKKREMLRF
jgi:hypothetical protein